MIHDLDDLTRPPWYGLLQLGPLIPVTVRLHPADEEAVLTEHGVPPQSVVGMALIDTGASLSVVDARVMTRLRPTIHGTTAIKGFRDDEAHAAPRFHIAIQVTEPALSPWLGAVAGAPLSTKASTMIALLGRDFLRKHVFTYDGPAGNFRLRRAET